MSSKHAEWMRRRRAAERVLNTPLEECPVWKQLRVEIDDATFPVPDHLMFDWLRLAGYDGTIPDTLGLYVGHCRRRRYGKNE